MNYVEYLRGLAYDADTNEESNVLHEVADYIETLEKDVAHKQARIDALMLEFCPEEMPKEQVAEWAKHQVPAQHRLICKRCGVDRFASPCPENGILCPVIGDAAMQGETE